jgi:hypothetical protein
MGEYIALRVKLRQLRDPVESVNFRKDLPQAPVLHKYSQPLLTISGKKNRFHGFEIRHPFP